MPFFREVHGTYQQLADRGKTLLRQRLREGRRAQDSIAQEMIRGNGGQDRT